MPQKLSFLQPFTFIPVEYGSSHKNLAQNVKLGHERLIESPLPEILVRSWSVAEGGRTHQLAGKRQKESVELVPGPGQERKKKKKKKDSVHWLEQSGGSW